MQPRVKARRVSSETDFTLIFARSPLALGLNFRLAQKQQPRGGQPMSNRFQHAARSVAIAALATGLGAVAAQAEPFTMG
jgi:hypothetical protein